MQKFLFLCTMLIIASEAFPEEIPGSGILKKTEQKSREFEPYPIYPNRGRFMSGDVSLSHVFIPYLYKAPFFVPLSTNRKKGGALRRIGSARRFRKKFSRKRKWAATYPRHMTDSFPFGSPECPEYLVNPDGFSDTHRDLSNFDSPSAVISRNRNQYSIRSYPRNKEGAFKRFKRLRLSPLERQYWNSIRFKNKRNANNVSNQENASEDINETKTSREGSNISKAKPQWEAVTCVQEKKESPEYKSCKKNLGTRESKNPEENGTWNETEAKVKGNCETRTHKSSLTSEGRSYSENLKKDLTTGEDPVRENAQEYASHIGKLKDMLEQVQSLLKEDIGKTREKPKQTSKDKIQKLTDKVEESSGKSEKSVATFTLKDKIDTAIPILMQISEDLVKISNATEGTPKSAAPKEKVSLRCSPDGTWTSTEYGLEMTFKTLPNMMLKVTTTSKAEGVINKKWSVQGLTLSKEEGPIILAAICPQKRKIASFMGQCKVCKDQDIIFGSWTMYTFVHKYTDLWKAVDFRLDVLKKKQVGAVRGQ